VLGLFLLTYIDITLIDQIPSFY